MKATLPRTLTAVMLAVSCQLSAGVTATWTGAQDAYWTNAANWLVDGAVPERCPGVVEPSDGSAPAMPTGDIAIFDGTCRNGRTTIDLDGHYSVLEVRVQGADCPRYAFGTSTSQRLVFEKTKAGGVDGMVDSIGKFTVSDEVPADSAPVVNASVYTGNFDYNWWKSATAFKTVLRVINNSQGTMVFNSQFAKQSRRPSSPGNYAEVFVSFEGCGNLEFNAAQEKDGNWLVSYDYKLTGKVMINGKFTEQKRVTVHNSCKVVLGENGVYGTYTGNHIGFSVVNGSTLTVEGEGKMQLVEYTTGKSFENHGFNTLDTGYIDVYSRLDCYGNNIILNGSTPNVEKRALRLYGPPANFVNKGGFLFHKCPYLAVKSTNSLGNCRSFTVTNSLGAASSAFMWEGCTAGEALTIPINYIGAESSVFTVQNNGSAPFTVSSAVTVPDGNKQLVLKGNTAPLILAPTLSEDIKLGLAGEIVLPESTSLENVSSVTIAADTCLTVEGAAERTLPPVSVTGGESEIVFTDAVRLNFPGLTVSGGTLDIKVGDSGASVVFKDTASAGTSPSGLLLDGYPASISSDGKLVVNPTAVNNEIAARGSVVPDAAGATVGITSAGSGEADVLESETTTVKALVQQTSTAAVVAIEAGQTLAADEVAIDHGFGSLTVGNVAGRGALGSAESPLILRNDSPVATLSVNAKIASPDVTRSGIGDIVLTGGMTPVMDSMSLNAGETCINGGTWNTSTSTCVTVRDGAVLTVGGDARLLSNAGTSWVEKTVANIDVTDGILKIEDDAVITNRITLNRSVSGKISAIYQSGGTVYEQGTGSTFHVFASASQGYWDLSGGKLDFVGVVGMGESDSIASIRQSGGEIYSAASAFRVGAGQRAMAEFVMTGGTGNFANMNIRDWGQYTGTRSTVTIDGPAYMEVRAAAQMAFENWEKPSSFTCSMLNLAGGVFSANAACRGGRDGGVISRDMSKVYVNFNGGTYRTRADTSGVGGRGLFGHAIGGTGNNNTWVDYVTIYSGGATIETDNPQRKVYIHTPLRAPVGKGVASVDFSAYRGKRTGLTAPPAVVIDGDGEGASAYAVFDVETGSITGVRVVSPGWGYTTATARFYSGNVYNFNGCPVTLADAVSGGLTKAGSGSLYLNAENTYTGETVLKGGTLHLVCSGALPAESVVAYEGGELKSTAAAFPSAIKVRIPGAENGSVRRCDLATFTDSCPDALPEVEVVNVPENVKPRWVAGFRGLILYVKRFAGSVISFR